MYVPAGALSPAEPPKPGNDFGFLDVLPSQDNLGFFDGIRDGAAVADLAVTFGVFAGPLQTLG